MPRPLINKKNQYSLLGYSKYNSIQLSATAYSMISVNEMNECM